MARHPTDMPAPKSAFCGVRRASRSSLRHDARESREGFSVQDASAPHAKAGFPNPRMFDDFEDSDLEFDEDASDREILHVIWLRSESRDLPTDEGWTVLSERYPGDMRLRITQLIAELASGRYEDGSATE